MCIILFTCTLLETFKPVAFCLFIKHAINLCQLLAWVCAFMRVRPIQLSLVSQEECEQFHLISHGTPRHTQPPSTSSQWCCVCYSWHGGSWWRRTSRISGRRPRRNDSLKTYAQLTHIADREILIKIMKIWFVRFGHSFYNNFPCAICTCLCVRWSHCQGVCVCRRSGRWGRRRRRPRPKLRRRATRIRPPPRSPHPRKVCVLLYYPYCISRFSYIVTQKIWLKRQVTCHKSASKIPASRQVSVSSFWYNL